MTAFAFSSLRKRTAAFLYLLVSFCLVFITRAEFKAGAEFEADELVETIQVKISIEGDDLEEPVALDLGLGFPFWLYPVGQDQPTFGAIPQTTDPELAQKKLESGKTASFTFHNQAMEKGQDLFLTSSRLLDEVTISDISRIGFASPANSAWVLKSYEILINEKPFASNSDAAAEALPHRIESQQRIAELLPIIAPLQAEAQDLASLIEAGLAMDEDEALLEEIQLQIVPLLTEKSVLERQLDGGFPWFIEPDFESAWRSGEAIGEARVTVITAAHTGAETHNYIYFQTGGHKYLLSSPVNPLDPNDGARVFPLDLIGAPLTAGDLRGFAVGMLAHDYPYGDAPDRWHPQRLMVEIDGRVVYDSDEVNLDRLSLEAIRVVPPAHRNAESEVVENAPILRETFLWEAGQGAGIDLVNGGAAQLPEEGDPDFPPPEPGLAGGSPPEDGFDPGFPPFPGETIFDPGWAPGPTDWMPAPGFSWAWWSPAPSWLDLLGGILDLLSPFIPGIVPPPLGDPPQVTAVRMDMPPFPAGNFTVKWDVTGNEGLVDHYAVQILPMYPDRVAPIVFAALAEELNVPVGTREWTFPLSALPDPVAEQPYAYLLPVVTAIPVPGAPGLGPEPELGPAKPYLFTGTSPAQLTIDPNFLSLLDGVVPVSLAGDPGGPQSAVWLSGETPSHRGLLFDDASPALNVGMRVAPGDELMLGFSAPMEGLRILSGYLGFEGGPEVANNIETDNIAFLYQGPGPPVYQYPPAPPPLPAHNVTNPAGGPAVPMNRLEMSESIDTVVQAGGVGLCELIFYIMARGGGTHPDHPCVLYGARLFEP